MKKEAENQQENKTKEEKIKNKNLQMHGRMLLMGLFMQLPHKGISRNN